jgi:pyruvate/2-oxoglutarate dehydrogenase complex dihydrolipoamide dehydrogenase (E3) component
VLSDPKHTDQPELRINNLIDHGAIFEKGRILQFSAPKPRYQRFETTKVRAMQIEHFDILVFGGGKAGKTLAIDQAKAGKRVAMIEAGMIGGSCINVACIPSKTFIRSAEIAHALRSPTEFGSLVDGVGADFAAVASRTASVVAEMVKTNQASFDASGMTLVRGWGKFVASKTIEVQTDTGIRRLHGEKVYINLGTSAQVPDVPGLAQASPLTHVEALKIDSLPKKLIVIGGGYIGLELGQAVRRFGADVTVLERNSRLAPREDQDASDAILSALTEEGLNIVLNAKDLKVSGKSGDAVRVECNGKEYEGTHILVAAGRQPRTHGIGLDKAGVELDDRGFIKVDEHLRTSAPDVWAMGEVAGTPMFTHASLDDYRVVKSGMTGGARTTVGRLIPYCVFIDPEFARIGINENEAIRAGVGYRVAKLPMDVIPRARTLSKRKGFMKALVEEKSDRIIGFSMLGVNAGEVMTVVQMTMLGGLPYSALRDGIFAHPTISEGLNMLFATVGAPKN